MEVVEATSAWLSDYEVYRHLTKCKEDAEASGGSKHASENIRTVEFEALEYFTKISKASNQTPESISALLEYLKPIALTKAEKLQMINLIPRNMLDFHLIVEECEERFQEPQIQEILDKINNLFPLPAGEEESAKTE